MDNKKHILTKSAYIRGLQCLKSLYLDRKRPFLRDRLSDEQKSKFKRGHQIGYLAQELFPGGIDVSPSHPSQYNKSLTRTHELIKSCAPVIYEACFKSDDILIMLDILVLIDGRYHAYEVKSSMKISQTYLHDAALQYHVITRSGLELADFSIIYLDGDYVYDGSLELNLLFKKVSVLNEILTLQDFCSENIFKQKNILLNPHSPKIEIGMHCDDPYPCDFKGVCWKILPDCSVFSLYRADYQFCFDLFKKGYQVIQKIPENVKLSEVQFIQKKSCQKEKPVIEIQSINRYFNDISFPITVMSLLVFSPAMPLFVSTSPFQTIPYGIFTLSIQKPGDTPSGDHFMIDMNNREQGIRQLSQKAVAIFKEPGTLLIYRKESATILQTLPGIETTPKNIRELFYPLENALFYHPGLRGDFTLLNVAKVLLDEDDTEPQSVRNDTVAADLFAMSGEEGLATESDIEGIVRFGYRKALLQLKLFNFWTGSNRSGT